MDPKKDLLAELDLAGLFEKRAETVEKQEEAAVRLDAGKARHFALLWLGGGTMALAATWVTRAFPESEPMGVFLLSACIILGAGMWAAAFFPALTVRRLQDRANALSRQLRDLDLKIEFCHQVLEEAKKVKVRKYAEAWVEKQTS